VTHNTQKNLFAYSSTLQIDTKNDDTIASDATDDTDQQSGSDADRQLLILTFWCGRARVDFGTGVS
jgi:hypothetical protein